MYRHAKKVLKEASVPPGSKNTLNKQKKMGKFIFDDQKKPYRLKSIHSLKSSVVDHLCRLSQDELHELFDKAAPLGFVFRT